MTTSGYINEVPIGWQDKKVSPKIRLVENDTPGRYGSSLDSFKEGGIDITLDIIANSITERNSIVAAFMQSGRSKLGLGGVDAGWYYTGKCSDRSTNLALSDWVPEEMYPLSFLFTTDEPFMYSETIHSRGVKVAANLATWSADTRVAGNKAQNPYFADWSPSVSSSSSTLGTAITTSVGANTYGLVFSLDGTKVYVANYTSGNIAVITVASNSITATITASISSPWGVALSPDGTKLYVTNSGNNTVTVYNTSNNALAATINVGTTPKGIVAHPNGSKVYVANSGSNNVSIINTATNTVSATVAVGSTPNFITTVPNRTEVWVGNSGANTISIINVSSETVTSTWDIGGVVKSVLTTPDGSKTYILYGTNSLKIYDWIAGTNSTKTTTGSGVCWMAMNLTGTRLFIINSTSTYYVQIWDIVNEASLGTVTLSYAPNQIAISNIGDKLYFTTSSTRIYPVTTPQIIPDTWQVASGNIAISRYRSSTFDGLRIVAPSTGISRLGEVWQGYNFFEDVEYTFGIFVTIADRTSGVVTFELQEDGTVIESETYAENATDPVWLTFTHTFTSVPKNVTLRAYVDGSPTYPEIVKISSPVVTETDNFDGTTIGRTIACSGSVNSVPDIIISGVGIGSGTINQSSGMTAQTWTAADAETSSNSTTFTAIYTKTFAAVAGASYLITGVGMTLRTGATSYYGSGMVTISSTGIYGSVESTVNIWNTNSTTAKAFSISSLKIQCLVNTAVTIKYYVKVSTSAGLVYFQGMNCSYTGGYVGSTASSVSSVFPANLKICNSDDETRKMEIANVLYPGETIRINADGSGWMTYEDNFATSIYSLIATSLTGVSYSDTVKDISITSGNNITYPFDLKYPIVGVPTLYLLVEQGTPYVYLKNYSGLDVSSFYITDYYATSITANSLVKYSLINSQNCNLAGSTRFDLKIAPSDATTLKIKAIFLVCSLITIDSQLPEIVQGEDNTFKVFMDNDAACNIGLIYNDRIWGI